LNIGGFEDKFNNQNKKAVSLIISNFAISKPKAKVSPFEVHLNGCESHVK